MSPIAQLALAIVDAPSNLEKGRASQAQPGSLDVQHPGDGPRSPPGREEPEIAPAMTLEDVPPPPGLRKGLSKDEEKDAQVSRKSASFWRCF